MNRVNFFKRKCEALEIFYDRVEQGNSYNEAAEQSSTQNNVKDELWEVILTITIATRFERCGKEISELFCKQLEDAIGKYKSLDLRSYDMSESELMALKEDVEEAEYLVR